MDVKNKRNFILLGHAQSGKTSLAEALLYFCKATSRKGAVADGTTVSDYSSDEIERKSSINLSVLFCDYKGNRVQIIDTPGYADFYGEVVQGVRAVDSAVLIVDAAAGVEVGTEKAWQIIEENNLPCIIFINKADKEGADIQKAISDIRSTLTKKAFFIDKIDDPELIEAVAESDDKLLEKYLESGSLSVEEAKAALTQAVAKCKVFPVVSGSALTDKGLAELLEAVVKYLPDPQAKGKVETADPAKPDTKKELSLTTEGPFSAFVFKNISDPYVGQLTLMRVLSGSLASNTGFYNVNKKAKERIGTIFTLQGKEQRATDGASCGDIVAIAKLKETAVGDSISNDKEQFLYGPLVFQEAAISA